jgi:hypothetical protein
VTRRPSRASAEGERRLALLVGLGAAGLLMGLLLLAQPLLRRLFDRPLPSGAPAGREAQVDVWVGDLAPGVKGILGNVYDEPEADRKNDRAWNEALGVREPLAYYRLHVANTSSDTVRVDLRDGVLTLTPPGGGAPLGMRSLAPLLAAGTSPLRGNLAAVGSGRESLEVPAGSLATPYVAFPRRIPLGEAAGVARSDGTAFQRRRIPLDRWEDLRASPTARAVEDL